MTKKLVTWALALAAWANAAGGITPDQHARHVRHDSLLKSLENIYQLGYLGYAAQSGLKAFGSDVFNVP
jgi:hypothetical protein